MAINYGRNNERVSSSTIDSIIDAEQAKSEMDLAKYRAALDEEVEDMRFNMSHDGQLLGSWFAVTVIILLLTLRLWHKGMLRVKYLGAPTSTMIIPIVLVIISVMMVCIWIFLVVSNGPSINSENFTYKGKRYHYSEITQVTMPISKVLAVKVNGRTLFFVTKGYDNYSKFKMWLYKCGIRVD